MSSDPSVEPSPSDSSSKDGAPDEVRRSLRGSGLLLMGRVIGILINFGTQVLTVRYLTKADYGAFSWAVAIVTMGSTFGLLSMHKAVGRYLPLYIEKDDPPAQRGVILLALGSTIATGLALIALAFGIRGLLGDTIVQDPQAIGLLLILVFLVPLQSLDSLLHSTFAVLASPRAIFFRRHILAPVLRLIAVLTILATAGSVRDLAFGYLIAGTIGIVTYLAMLRSLLRKIGLFGPKATPGIRTEPKEIYRFGIPLLTTDLLWFLKSTVVIIVLESMKGTESVAEFRAVVPLAALNVLLLENVRVLYQPLAARFVARGDGASLNQLYAQVSTWITVITFPLFATCVFLSEPVTTLLFGSRYSSASSILVALAIGQYYHAIFGLNRSTLNAHGRVRLIVWANFASAILALTLQFTLIPQYGSLGAGIATGVTYIASSALIQFGMVRTTGIGRLGRDQLRTFLALGTTVAFLSLVWAFFDHPIVLAIAVALSSVLMFWWNRSRLEIVETFPELKRVPILGRLSGG